MVSSARDLPLLNLRRVFLWPAIFLVILVIAHKLVWRARQYVVFDCPPHWPLSIFNFRGPHHFVEYAAIVVTVALGVGAIWLLPKRGYRKSDVAFVGLLLVLSSNAIQGIPKGFYNPIAGGIGPEQYYHDSRKVESPTAFLRDFVSIQPSLRTHARTHPPGAVLIFYGMRELFGNYPSAMSVAIAVVSTLLSAWAFPILLRNLLAIDDDFAGYATFLYLVLPAVQIYYCATLDALICALLLAAAAVWSSKATPQNTLIGSAFVALASFLTFGFVWVFPILIAVDAVRRGWRRWLIPLGAIVLLYVVLYLIFGFNYFASSRLATHLENPFGYRLLIEPISFGFTRIEDVSEILVFFGPFLIGLSGLGIAIMRRAENYRAAFWAAGAAVGTLLFLFLTGAFHTGETARACIFIYPYLLLPAIIALRDASNRDRSLLLALVLAQTVAMQEMGNFFW